jgi:hypothetical protein
MIAKVTAMRARIFQQPKTAMQSGTAGTGEWVLDFEPQHRQHQDPLMGWNGGASTQSQVRLRFPTKDDALAYAERNGLAYDLEIAATRVHKPKAYADNFKYGRLENWTH